MIMKKNTAIARFAIFIFTVMCSLPVMAQDENIGFHQALKTKFIEGNAGFMSLVAIALIVGLAFCIEHIGKKRGIEVGVLIERQIIAYQIEQTENQHSQTYQQTENLLRYLFGRLVTLNFEL
jgi:hypothetical protein